MSFDDADNDPLKDMLDEVPRSMRGGFPDPNLSHEGNKTIISNFKHIIAQINRAETHLKKFISSNLGVKTKLKDSQLQIFASISKGKLEIVFAEYAERYILCSNCGKPDTILTKLKKSRYNMRCLACGQETVLKQN